MVRESAAMVRGLVNTHQTAVMAIADQLIELGTLSGDRVRELIAKASR
jgi:ATP-dependent Zn protease